MTTFAKTKPPIIIGIDPGLTGAVAAINTRNQVVIVRDTPSLIVKKSGKSSRKYLESEMARILETLAERIILCVGIENQHARPGTSAKSMFSIATGYGIWIGILAAMRLPVERIEPVVWKKAMGIPSGSDKTESIVRATRLFPKASLSRKKDHNRAEALLLAAFLSRKLGGNAAPPGIRYS